MHKLLQLMMGRDEPSPAKQRKPLREFRQPVTSSPGAWLCFRGENQESTSPRKDQGCPTPSHWIPVMTEAIKRRKYFRERSSQNMKKGKKITTTKRDHYSPNRLAMTKKAWRSEVQQKTGRQDAYLVPGHKWCREWLSHV